MSEGIVLLSADGYYIGLEGQLPFRPEFDKKFLTALAKGKRIVASTNTIKDLPKSIVTQCKELTTDTTRPWDLNLGIATFGSLAGLPDVMFIVKSPKTLNGGKKFKLSLFEEHYATIYNSNSLQILIKFERKQNG